MARHSTRPTDAPDRDIPAVADLRRDQRERRARIVAAAAEMLRDHDHDDIQVRDVAVEADVALGTLYRYFASKEHLFACALGHWADGFGARIEPDDVAPPVERVKAVYGRAARAFERTPRVFDVITQLLTSRDPHASAAFAEFNARQVDAFAGALAGDGDLDRSGVTDVMNAVLSEALRGWRAGMISGAEMHRRIDRAAELLLDR